MDDRSFSNRKGVEQPHSCRARAPSWFWLILFIYFLDFAQPFQKPFVFLMRTRKMFIETYKLHDFCINFGFVFQDRPVTSPDGVVGRSNRMNQVKWKIPEILSTYMRYF